MDFLQKTLPVADGIEAVTRWFTGTFADLFAFIQTIGEVIMNGLTDTLLLIPPLLFVGLITVFMYFISRKKIGLTVFTLIGLLFIYNQNLWDDLMNTLTLVVLASVVSIILGIPLGILMSKSSTAQKIITPILDFMQTMPAFVYLIPAVAFFGIGMVPGVFASVIFALPPTVRFTNLGIRQVPMDLIEASESFGSTSWQRLFKLELPLAKRTIFAGVNQTTMLSLSMVVTASMIGAPGLGRGVLSALQRAQVGNGFVNGLSLVVLAIIIDRITQNLNRQASDRRVAASNPQDQKKRRWTFIAIAAAAFLFVGGSIFYSAAQKNDRDVELSLVQWDTEIASTNVVAAVLEDMGYNVTLTPLDNAVMWESVASGEADAMVGAWLPNTHGAMYERYGEQMVDLGPNLEGVKIGLVVPSYMDVDSIDELTDEAGQIITGIEPGAGVVAAAEGSLELYDNLGDWSVETSSSGAMTVALGQAIENQEEIIVTGWSPHWMFAEYDLKYLEDPSNGMGEAESIHSMARLGLKEDMPEVYRLLDNFNWTSKDMEDVMLEINSGVEPETAARNWIQANPDRVAGWKK